MSLRPGHKLRQARTVQGSEFEVQGSKFQVTAALCAPRVPLNNDLGTSNLEPLSTLAILMAGAP